MPVNITILSKSFFTDVQIFAVPTIDQQVKTLLVAHVRQLMQQ